MTGVWSNYCVVVMKPLSSFADLNLDSDEPAVEPDRFRPPDAPKWAGGWVSFPAPWEGLPEERLLSKETRRCLEKAIEALPGGLLWKQLPTRLPIFTVS